MGEQRRERRYRPSPYPPRSDATRAYRDGWDLGWKHVAVKRSDWAREYFERMGGDNGSPHQVGYRDGARARLAYEQRAKVPDRDVVRRDRELEERWRREAGSEPPY